MTEADRRYRMLVSLVRTDRPTHWKWHCPRCTMPVAEFINSDVIATTDLMDFDNPDTHLVGVRCDGRYQGARCSFWFYFSIVGEA